jgi:activator of HSP90 ATPase
LQIVLSNVSQKENTVFGDLITRRELSVRFFSTLATLGLAEPGASAAAQASFSNSNGLSHSSESIHQEVLIKASRDRVYRALTDARQFREVTELSYQAVSTEISPEVGGAFSLFGGLIVGRHIEMLPNERLVQAWREKPWDPGFYSIVSFQLNETGSGTRVIFDHRGFPQGKGEHLAIGWKSHYWEPLQKYLA